MCCIATVYPPVTHTPVPRIAPRSLKSFFNILIIPVIALSLFLRAAVSHRKQVALAKGVLGPEKPNWHRTTQRSLFEAVGHMRGMLAATANSFFHKIMQNQHLHRFFQKIANTAEKPSFFLDSCAIVDISHLVFENFAREGLRSCSRRPSLEKSLRTR